LSATAALFAATLFAPIEVRQQALNRRVARRKRLAALDKALWARINGSRS
jgi:hypothetical protein